MALLLGGSSTIVAAAPATAVPGVTVTPSTGLVDGQSVTVSMTDLPAGLWAVLQCRGPFDITTQSVLDHCNFLAPPTEGTPPASVTAAVEATLTVNGPAIDCATVIDACKVVASTYDSVSNSYVFAETAITFGGAVPPPPPTVTVTPSVVTDGQTVTVGASGFPSGTWAIAECPASVAIDSTAAIFANCRWMAGPSSGTPPASSLATVLSSYLTIDGSRTVNYLVEVGGCSVGVGVLTPTGLVSASVPIDFGSTLLLDPSRGLADGAAVAASTSAADGAYTLAQCRASAIAPGSGPTDSRCGPTAAVTVTGGAIAPPFTVDEPLLTRDGSSVPCGSHDCVLVLQTATGDVEASAAVSFGPPFLATDPPLPVPPESVVTVHAGGMAGTSVTLSRCVEPIGPTRCDQVVAIALDAWGGGSAPSVWLPTWIDADGTTFDCRVASCVLVAGDVASPQAVLPVTFTPPPVVTLTPSTGLLEGQTVQVDATGLRPGFSYTVQRCTPLLLCETLNPNLVAGLDGTASFDVTASQRVGSHGYCRADCRIVLAYSGVDDGVAPYAMAVGSLAANPSTGLAPGQMVQVTGSSLMPSYAGPMLGSFPTGGWAIGQCDAAIVGNVSLYSAFLHCSLGPSLQPITISGSTLGATATVEGVITKILGGTTDCTAAPGACVLGIFRFEQDASASGYTVPLSFG